MHQWRGLSACRNFHLEVPSRWAVFLTSPGPQGGKPPSLAPALCQAKVSFIWVSSEFQMIVLEAQGLMQFLCCPAEDKALPVTCPEQDKDLPCPMVQESALSLWDSIFRRRLVLGVSHTSLFFLTQSLPQWTHHSRLWILA